jgi:hypothetical protein
MKLHKNAMKNFAGLLTRLTGLMVLGLAGAGAAVSSDGEFTNQINAIQKSVTASPARISRQPAAAQGAAAPKTRARRFQLVFDPSHSQFVCEDKNLKKGFNKMTLAALQSGSSGECADLHGDSKLIVKNDRSFGRSDYLVTMGRLSGANLRGANFKNFSLNGSDLSGADLTGADLRNTDLTGVNLGGANVSGADMRGAKLDATQLDGAIFSPETKLPWTAMADKKAAKEGMVKSSGMWKSAP